MSLGNQLALTPPMGWNSWDCFGTSVTEAEVKANADFMARQLKQFGWEYIVVDIQWYEPLAQAGGYRPFAALTIDAYGRLLPAPNRFPSAAEANGFKPLADYVHSLGLKFGIHIMRGIPRQAVERNLPILNSSYHAQDIANLDSPCPWNTDMFGLDMNKAGANAYIDSLVVLYSAWEVDYIKADDMLYPYHAAEIAAYHQALSQASRPILLSLSPGVELSLDHAEHLKTNSELWRISADFWDRWEDLDAQFDLCAQWVKHAGAGHWPDADMLPMGHIGIRAERGIDRDSLLTFAEQQCLISLWAMARSPLMMGGDLPSSSQSTIGLLSNPEILAINQHSRNNHEVLRQGDLVLWLAEDAARTYLAVFNRGESSDAMSIDLGARGFTNCQIRDLWKQENLGEFTGYFKAEVPAHSAAVFAIIKDDNWINRKLKK